MGLFRELDASPGMSVSYRAICGAPCSEPYLRNGWTTHVRITDTEGVEHFLDFFRQAPRVTVVEYDRDDPDYASRTLVAQMKKTDREKDWPFIAPLVDTSAVKPEQVLWIF